MSLSHYATSTIDLQDVPRCKGETDDCNRFQRAIELTPEGGCLYVPPGHYIADSILIRKPIHIQFSDQARVEATEVDRDILIVEGSREETHYQLQRPANRGEQEIHLSQEPIHWKSGDMIVLTDDFVRCGDGQQGINTEVHEIESISGKKVQLRDFVRLPKAISKKGINVYKVNPLEDVQIHQFHYWLKPGSKRGIGILMRYVRNIKVVGTTGVQGAGSGIQMRKAMHIRVERFRFEHPQVTGSGQGYGVQCFGGCNHIIISDGYTVACRHSVDLDGTFDTVVSHVMDVQSRGAAFMMSHNGFTSDIVFEHCKTYQTRGSGFVAESQGYADPLDCVFYGFVVRQCQVVMNNTANACIYFRSPCQESQVLDCQLSYQASPDSVGLNNAGIRCYPARSDLFITGCRIAGVRRGIALQVAGRLQLTNDTSVIRIRDTIIQNCNAAILFHQGWKRRVWIQSVHSHQIHGKLLEIQGQGSFQELVLNGIDLTQSPSCAFHIGRYQADSICNGQIQQIRTDYFPYVRPTKNKWELTTRDLYLHGDGELVCLEGDYTVSGNHPLPDGWIEGQQLTLLTLKGIWHICQGKNMRFLGNQSVVQLSDQQRSITFRWKNHCWFQV